MAKNSHCDNLWQILTSKRKGPEIAPEPPPFQRMMPKFSNIAMIETYVMSAAKMSNIMNMQRLLSASFSCRFFSFSAMRIMIISFKSLENPIQSTPFLFQEYQSLTMMSRLIMATIRLQRSPLYRKITAGIIVSYWISLTGFWTVGLVPRMRTQTLPSSILFWSMPQISCITYCTSSRIKYRAEIYKNCFNGIACRGVSPSTL